MQKNSWAMFIALLFLLLMPVAQAADPKPDSFSAGLQHKLSATQKMDLGVGNDVIKWSCTGTHCRGTGHTSDVVAACENLRNAPYIGKAGIKTFIAKGRILGVNCSIPR
jgi:hypothetical protein